MKKIFTGCLFFMLPAVTWGISSTGYNFSGDFSSEFLLDSPIGSGTWAQSGGVGNFTSSSTAQTETVLVWKKYALPYNSDWDISLTITVPTFYDTDLADPDSGDEYVGAVLAVQHEDADGFGDEFIATSGLSVSSFFGDAVTRDYFGDFILNNTALASFPETTANTTITASLSFDAITKELTAKGDSTTLYVLDLENGDPGWNMSSGDLFTVGIIGASNLNEVFVGNPITVDDFSVVGAVPIPEPAWIGVVLGLVALFLSEKRRS